MLYTFGVVAQAIPIRVHPQWIGAVSIFLQIHQTIAVWIVQPGFV